jgi:hypothetical protein
MEENYRNLSKDSHYQVAFEPNTVKYKSKSYADNMIYSGMSAPWTMNSK